MEITPLDFALFNLLYLTLSITIIKNCIKKEKKLYTVFFSNCFLNL